jgi:lipid-A-disaccharide synthase
MRIGIVAGEASGDLLGAGLISAIKARVPNAVFEGIAGPYMVAQGCHAILPAEKLAVMGLVEVIAHYRELHVIRNELQQYFLKNPPDVFIGIDAPDFNLGLERSLKQAHIPTVHYVSPSVWAWRHYRVRKIAESVDLMLTLLPFEAAFYEAQQRYSAPVCFVGHPLADTIPILSEQEDASERQALRATLGLPATAEVVALLPGSRVSELRYLADRFAQTAAWCTRQRPQLQFIAPQANTATRKLFQQALARHAPDITVHILDGQAQEAMRAADVVLVASGTATLEALLVNRPMVVAYRMAWLTAIIMRRLLKVPYYSLPNLLAAQALVEEFSQEEVTAENLGNAILQFFEQPDKASELCKNFAGIHRSLRQGASVKAAEAVLGLVERGVNR